MIPDPLGYILDRYGLRDYAGKMPITLQMSRWNDLPALFWELGYREGAEIGVDEGAYSEHLCQNIPGLQLFSIDPWQHYPEWNEIVTPERIEAHYQTAVQRLASYNCHIMRKFSIEAAQDFQKRSLDFVFIDGNHEFMHVAQDIFYWEQKVRRGGIVAGHDFGRKKGSRYIVHVKDVVQAWAYSHHINPWFVMRATGEPCWMWVKT